MFVTRAVPTTTYTTARTYTAPVPTATTVINSSSYQRQSGGRHVIAQGETIANIARLYGYTEERFREFNVLTPGQELTPGSVVLATDCSCDRVSYSDQSGGLFTGQWNDRLIPHNENAYYHKRYNNNETVTQSINGNGNTSSYYNKNYTPPSQNNNNQQPGRFNNGSATFQNNNNQQPGSFNNGSATFQNNNNRQPGSFNNGSATSWGRVNATPTTPPNTNTNYNTNTNTNNSGWRRDNPSKSNNNRFNTNTPPPYSNERSAGSYMSNREQQMVNEINLVRSNPAGYVTYVEQYIRDIKSGKAFGSSATAAYELIDELKKTAPLSVLQPTECLYQTAKKHGEEAIRKGSSDHQGIDGSWPWDRVKRGCAQMQDGNENLVGGPESVREAVMLLLVDDGISNRGHRRTLLNKDWRYVACYNSGTVGRMPNSWVQLFGY